MSPLFLFNVILKVFEHKTKKKKTHERKTDRKKIKVSLSAMICWCIKEPKTHAMKLLELINTFSKETRYRINMQNQLPSYILMTSTLREKIEETIPITII